jgi:hypothetical protein
MESFNAFEMLNRKYNLGIGSSSQNTGGVGQNSSSQNVKIQSSELRQASSIQRPVNLEKSPEKLNFGTSGNNSNLKSKNKPYNQTQDQKGQNMALSSLMTRDLRVNNS